MKRGEFGAELNIDSEARYMKWFRTVQRPMKSLLTSGTHLYNNQT